MPVVKRIFNFYINASIHVAFAVVSLYLVTIIFIKGSTNWDLAFFLGLGTIACYNFIKYGVEAEKYLIVANPAHKSIQIFSILSLIGALFFFFKLSASLWGIVLVLGSLSLLYAVPFLPKAKNLRSLGGMKVFLVALVWVGCTGLLPMVDNHIALGISEIAMLLQRFLLVLVLLIPFEIRDLNYDDSALKTFPQRLGVAKTKKLGYALLVGYVLLMPWATKGMLGLVLVQFSLFLLLFFAIKNSAVDAPEYYASFWVEGIPLLYLVLVFFAQCV